MRLLLGHGALFKDLNSRAILFVLWLDQGAAATCLIGLFVLISMPCADRVIGLVIGAD